MYYGIFEEAHVITPRIVYGPPVWDRPVHLTRERQGHPRVARRLPRREQRVPHGKQDITHVRQNHLLSPAGCVFAKFLCTLESFFAFWPNFHLKAHQPT